MLNNWVAAWVLGIFTGSSCTELSNQLSIRNQSEGFNLHVHHLSKSKCQRVGVWIFCLYECLGFKKFKLQGERAEAFLCEVDRGTVTDEFKSYITVFGILARKSNLHQWISDYDSIAVTIGHNFIGEDEVFTIILKQKWKSN